MNDTDTTDTGDCPLIAESQPLVGIFIAMPAQQSTID
jgi:hypothetical protein